MILLSLVLVVVSATALAFGVFTTGDALVWTSLGAGLGAVALVTGSVVRRRRSLGAASDAAGPAAAGAVAVGPAPAGFDPAPSPAPSRATSTGSPPPPAGDADPPPDPQPGDRVGPWATAPPGGSVTRGWSGHVPSVRPAPDPPASDPPASDPAASPAAAVPGSPHVPTPLPGSPQVPPQQAGPPGSAPSRAGLPRVPPPPVEPEPEDGVERVPVRDALRVAQLADEVVVEDGRPRYHLAGCATLDGAPTVTLAVSAARRGGFTPCAVCTPDRVLLQRLADRRAGSD